MSGFELGTLIVSVLIALTVHEVAHAYVSLRLGDDTAQQQGRVSFNPLHHIDPVATIILPVMTLLILHAPILAARPVPFNPSRVRFGELGSAMIAGAGPASNLLMALLAALLLHSAGGGWLGQGLYIFLSLNVALFIFNLVPIPPLDGSRLLYAIAPESVQEVMAHIEPY